VLVVGTISILDNEVVIKTTGFVSIEGVIDRLVCIVSEVTGIDVNSKLLTLVAVKINSLLVLNGTLGNVVDELENINSVTLAVLGIISIADDKATVIIFDDTMAEGVIGVGSGVSLISSVLLVAIVGSVNVDVKIATGFVVDATATIVSVEITKVGDMVILVKSTPLLLMVVGIIVSMLDSNEVVGVISTTKLVVSAVLKGEIAEDSDVALVISMTLVVVIVGSMIMLVIGIPLLLTSEVLMAIVVVINVLLISKTGKLIDVTIMLEVAVGLNTTSELDGVAVATVEIISLKELKEEVKFIVVGTAVSVNITLVDSVEGNKDDNVILDDSTTLVVVFLVALNEKVEVGVISSLVVVVKLIVALLTVISDVCELILEVSIAIVDEMIGGLGKGDTDDDKTITVLVKDILGVASLKLALVKNPLPSNSVVDIPGRLETSVATLLVVSNNVEARTLVSIPLPDPSSLLSSFLFSLLLSYCGGHIMSAESSFILKNVYTFCKCHTSQHMIDYFRTLKTRIPFVYSTTSNCELIQ